MYGVLNKSSSRSWTTISGSNYFQWAMQVHGFQSVKWASLVHAPPLIWHNNNLLTSLLPLLHKILMLLGSHANISWPAPTNFISLMFWQCGVTFGCEKDFLSSVHLQWQWVWDVGKSLDINAVQWILREHRGQEIHIKTMKISLKSQEMRPTCSHHD